MLTITLKSQKTSGGLGYLRVNDRKNEGIRIGVGVGTLHLVSLDFQGPD